MKDFTLAEIAKACNGEYVGDESLKNTKIAVGVCTADR